MKKWMVVLVIFLIAGSFDLAFSQGCSQCKLLAEQGSELDEGSFGSNINYGILYLMIIPYLLLFAFFHKQILGFLRGLAKK